MLQRLPIALAQIKASGHNTALIISKDEMKDILKIVKSLENSKILLKGVSETLKEHRTKEQRGGFLSMLLGTLGASLLSDMLTGKGVIRSGYGSKGQGTIIAGYGTKRSSFKNFFNKFLFFFNKFFSLTNFEIEAYYQNEPRCNGVST